MSSLSDFPAPSSGLPTICERNSKLVTDENINVLDYKRLDLADLSAQRKTLSCLESVCKPAFVNYEETIIDKLQSYWYSGGITGILQEIRNLDGVPLPIKKVSMHLYTGIKKWHHLQEKLHPKKTSSRSEHKQVTLLACHPHIARIAVALKDNSVKIVSMAGISSTDQELIIKDKRVQKITCLAWRPKSSLSIAVGSSKGILVWLLDPATASSRPGSNMSRFLHSKDMLSDVTSISWCADGTQLACTCKNSLSFWVWDVISQKSTPMHRVGSAVSFLTWSPCGQRLLSTNHSETFRIWETSNWACEKWADLNGNCNNACWSSCGSYLLFTMANEPSIYYLHFQNSKNSDQIDINGSSAGQSLICADVSKYMWQGCLEEIGGTISNMVWDPTNSRLAVTFRNDSTCSNQPYIALYHTRTTPLLQLVPCGFLRGDDEDIPMNMNFLHGYDKGALLAVYWSSESISSIPLLFNQKLTQSPRNFTLANHSGVIGFNRTMDDVADLSTMQNETALYSTFDQ